MFFLPSPSCLNLPAGGLRVSRAKHLLAKLNYTRDPAWTRPPDARHDGTRGNVPVKAFYGGLVNIENKLGFDF